ncbi:MAG: hypothetical protein Q4A28_09080 [Brachymonas sp.]|nr:hypothetical protein [Brachymonas sp.]
MQCKLCILSQIGIRGAKRLYLSQKSSEKCKIFGNSAKLPIERPGFGVGVVLQRQNPKMAAKQAFCQPMRANAPIAPIAEQRLAAVAEATQEASSRALLN